MPVISKINKDLQDERDKVKFNVEEFTNWFYDGEENVAERRSFEKYYLSDPELNLSLDTSYLSYKEKYEEAIRRNVILYKKFLKRLNNIHDEEKFKSMNPNHRLMQVSINNEGDPFMLQFSMFGFMIMNLTNDEQRAEWLPRVLNCNILGTYAQTELGHGTNLKGLETTSTYDPKTKEFVLNTPTLTAYKWWPGNMGHTVNYAVVMAQLYSLGKNHGIQPFIVQLRDEETHKPLPGITLGDIGNKLGYNSMNNGYLAFDNVRIPLKNMLMKSAQINENGEFVRTKKYTENYAAMSMMRVSIVHDTAQFLAKAVTIALRYSLVRRQSPIKPNEPEPKIIEHMTQQFKIFPPLSRAIVFEIAAKSLKKLSMEKSLNRATELHALSCCLKAVVTNISTRDVETCRLSCGGHGYLNSSGLPDMYRSITAGQSGEGENTVMLLQTAKFLLKSFNSAKNGEALSEEIVYISDYINRNKKRLSFNGSYAGILQALQFTTVGRLESAFNKIKRKMQTFSLEEATNQAGIELVRAAELYCQVFILEAAIEELENASKNSSRELGEVFKNVLELYAVDLVLNSIGDIMQFVDVTNDDIEKLQTRLENSLKLFRTSAIGVVDGFDFSDTVLNSTLGAYDGNVYERLIEAAKKSPLNQEDVNRTFHLYLKPFMKSNL